MRTTIMIITAIAFITSSMIAWQEIVETGNVTDFTMWMIGVSFASWLALIIQIGGMAAVRGRSFWLWFALAALNIWLAWGILIALPVVAVTVAAYRMLRGRL